MKWIVPYPAGGAVDVAARILAQSLEGALKQAIVVDNRPGGNTFIGVQAMRASKADGSTMMIPANDSLSLAPNLLKAPYEVEKDIDFVATFATGRPFLLIARKDFPAKDAVEAINLMRKDGANLNFASQGTGGISHLRMELLMSRIGTRMRHIPYKGAAPAMQDLLAGRIDVMADSPVNSLVHAKAGTVKVLAIMGAERFPELPDVMTLEEAGLGTGAGEFSTFVGLIAPKGTPAPAIKRVVDAIQAVLVEQGLREAFAGRGLRPNFQGPSAFRERVIEESAMIKKVIAAHHITADN